MFNVAVVRLKDLTKYVIAVTVIIAIIIFGKKIFRKNNLGKINIGQQVVNSVSNYMKEAINTQIPAANGILKKDGKQFIENAENNFESNLIIGLLNTEMPAFNAKKIEEPLSLDISNEQEKVEEQKNEEIVVLQEENNAVDNEENNNEEIVKQELETAKTDVKTEIVTKNPISDSFTKKYNGVKIKNETSFDLSEDLLNYENLKIDKSNIIIFHTHTCESYTSSEAYPYTPTGKFRTTDLNYSVARVGDELENYLKNYGINVIHNKTYHDYPAYNGSYSRSLATVSKILKSTSADIIIDLHRDAIGSNSSYAPTVKIGDDYCAQLMFVMGTNGGGLNHPDWKNNLQFAVKLQEMANKSYPGLFKPIIVRNSRYNQHLGKAACIIEVGSTRKYFGTVLK